VVEDFLAQVADWAVVRTEILAVALVGSYARGTAHRDSDVDLVVLTTTPLEYTSDANWARQFGRVASHEIEQWGRVTSVRVWYESSLEVEFGFVSPEWAATPLDEGTRRVVAGGIRVLMDRDGVLAGLAEGQTG
jgi:predicted nucleotidyltransferase